MHFQVHVWQVLNFHRIQKFNQLKKELFFESFINCVSIPPHIKQICSNSFMICEDLEFVNITDDSELQVIENDSFCFTSICDFYIPRHVKNIGDGAFANCGMLQIIEIDVNSELKFFGINMIYNSPIVIIMAPSNLKDIMDILS